MQDFTIIQWTTLALAAAAVLLNLFALRRNAATNRRIDRLPKPAWMGKWPPTRSDFINPAYDYSHLPPPEDELVARAVFFAGLRPNEQFTFSSSERRPCAQGSAVPKADQATAGHYRNDHFGLQANIQRATNERTPDDHATARRHPQWKPDLTHRITWDGRELALSLTPTSRPAIRVEANSNDGELHHAQIEYLHSDHAVFRINFGRSVLDEAGHFLTIDSIAPLHQQDRYDLQAKAVTPQRPERIDQPKHSTQYGYPEGDVAHPSNISHPSAP